MTAIYITGTTIALFNIAGVIFAIFMLVTRSDTSSLKKSNMKKVKGAANTASKKHAAGSAKVSGAAGVAGNGTDDKDDFDDIDAILNDLDLSDFDDLDLSDFD